MKTMNAQRRLGYLIILCSCLAAPVFAIADAKTDGERGIEAYRKGNLIEGMTLLKKSAQAGYAPAQSMFAYILDKSEDNEQAFHWYQEAAAQRDPAGLFGLGTLYANGEGTEKQPARAADLFERAARLGHMPAMRAYASALEHGLLGLPRDAEQAVHWYTQAAQHGDSVAARRLRDAYRSGDLGVVVDLARAEQWNRQITNQD